MSSPTLNQQLPKARVSRMGLSVVGIVGRDQKAAPIFYYSNIRLLARCAGLKYGHQNCRRSLDNSYGYSMFQNIVISRPIAHEETSRK